MGILELLYLICTCRIHAGSLGPTLLSTIAQKDRAATFQPPKVAIDTQVNSGVIE
jgi:hypothetical protein